MSQSNSSSDAGVPALVVRETRTPAEDETFYRTTARVFGDPQDDAALAAATARWRATIEDAAACYPVYRRAAFEGSVFLGSYTIYDRRLRLGTHGEAALRTACIGVVLAHPDRRRQGIGRALMCDAVCFAREREFALLLLGGIPDFYHRFGYFDVMERARQRIDRAHVEQLPAAEEMSVRPATEEDAPALLALYERHWGTRPGGFVRTLEEQRTGLRSATDGSGYIVAADGEGQPRGYVNLRGSEAGADTWAAASALLRHHLSLLDQAALVPSAAPGASAAEPPATLTWQVPSGSPTYYLLADHLPLTSETRSRPRAGWMARPAHLPSLIPSLVPALAARWQRAGRNWSGAVTLRVTADPPNDQEGGTYSLLLAPGHLELASDGTDNGHRAIEVRLHPGAFTQLLFGFRPVSWLAEQPGNDVPHDARDLLETLFPAEPAWIAASDGF